MNLDYGRLIKPFNILKPILDELNVNREDPAKKLPKAGTNVYDENLEEAKSDDKSNLYELFSEGKCYIMPAFFKAILALKKAKKEFAIVFRSFDNDLSNVIFEFNKFCNGEHPCYNGRNNAPLARLDGSKNSKKFIINSEHEGVIYRLNKNIENVTLVSGSLKRFQKIQNLEDAYAREIEEDTVKIIKGGAQIYLKMMELLKEVIFQIILYLILKKN